MCGWFADMTTSTSKPPSRRNGKLAIEQKKQFHEERTASFAYSHKRYKCEANGAPNK